MKLQDGDNRFRVLGRALEAAELWIDGKPVRRKSKFDYTKSDLDNADENKLTKMKSEPKEILAFPVYNYQTSKVEVLQLNQVTILRALDKYFHDEDWGDPQDYDIVIERSKIGDKVSYSVSPKPAKLLKPEVEDAWDEAYKAGFSIEALLTGGNPFGSKKPEESYTPAKKSDSTPSGNSLEDDLKEAGL